MDIGTSALQLLEPIDSTSDAARPDEPMQKMWKRSMMFPLQCQVQEVL